MKQNLVLIIGAMKSGTTSLFNHLTAHPEITGCNPKEPGFFAFEEIYGRGADWYESLFDFDPKQHRVALDGSTDYSKYPHCQNVPERIEQYGAQPKLLYIMRHPLRRIESHARHVQFKRQELGRIASPREDHSLDSGISDVSLSISKYASQIDQYKSYFERGRLKLLTLEELSKSPRSSLNDICEFLGVDGALLPEELERQNRGSDVRTVKRSSPLWRTARSVAPLRALAKVMIPATTRHKLRNQAAQKVKIHGRFELTPLEEEKTLEYLSSDLIRLRDVYGVDIKGQWGIDI